MNRLKSIALTKQQWQVLKEHGAMDEYPTFAQYMQKGGIDPYAAKEYFEVEDWTKYCSELKLPINNWEK